MTIQQVDLQLPIVDKDGKQTQEFNDWTIDVTNLQPLIGTGSPEGVVSADVLREYMDASGTAGNIKYIKRDSDILGDATKGWILV